MKTEQVDVILRSILKLTRRLRSERPGASAHLTTVSMLGTLHRLGAIPSKRLAAEEKLQPQSITRIVDALERQQCIVRSRNPEDRREVLISITDRGRRVLAQEIEARRGWLELAIATGLNTEEQTLLIEAARVLLKLSQTDTSTTSLPARKRSG